MKKRTFLFTTILLIVLMMIFVMVACSSNTGSSIQGKYYFYDNGVKDNNSYIELISDKEWTDGEFSGEYTLNGSSISLFIDGQEMMSGTLVDGVLTLDLWGMTSVYYKDGAYPSNSNSGSGDDTSDGSGSGSVEPPTPGQKNGFVYFDAKGGELSISQKLYEIGTVMADMPIPTREGYDFVGWETSYGESYTSSSVMPDLYGEILYLFAEWKKQVSTYSDEYVQFTPAVEGFKNDDDYYAYFYDKVDKYIYVELDIDYVGYGKAGEANNFRLGDYENLMFNTKEGYSLTWYTDAEFSKINGAQIFSLYYGSNVHFLTVSYQGTVRKTYLVDFYLLRDYYISLSDHIGGEPYAKVRVDEGGTFDKNHEWRWADKFECNKRVYYNTATGRYENFDYSTIIYQDWTLYQTYGSKTISYTNGDGESKTLNIKPFEDVALITPSKEGYTFIGWQQPDKNMFTDINGDSRLQLTGNNYFETLSPIWKENVFEKIDTVNSTQFKAITPTVLYDNNDELYKIMFCNQDNELCYSEQYSIKITYDLTSKGGSFDEFYTSTLKCPSVASSFREYTTSTSYTTYYFTGWYTQETGGQKFDFSAPIYGDITLYAHWSMYSSSYDYANEPSGGQCHIPEPTKTDKAYFCGDEVTLTAMENLGYTWLGWYDGNTELTTEESYKVTVSAENKTYTAKWTAYYVTAEKNIDDAGNIYIDGVIVGNCSITFNLNGGTGTKPATQSSGTATYPTTIPTRDGYVFAGWYDNQSCTGTPYDFTEDVIEPITLYAKWLSYSCTGVLTLNCSESISVVSKNSSTKHYYAFVPLTSGQITIYTTGSLDTYGYLYNSSKSQLAYDDQYGDGSNFKITYNVTAGTLYYVRPCGYSSSGTTTIHLEGALPEDGGEILNAPSTKMITAGESVTLTATTNTGYTWLGWYDGDTKISEGASLTYTFTMPAESKTYTAKWMECPVTLEKNIAEAGTVRGVETTAVGGETTITATTNAGYTWLGWYCGDDKVSEGTSLTYTFTMSAENKTYTAKWACYTVSTETNLAGAGSYTNYTEKKVAFGETVELIATTNPGYTWFGWYDGDTKVSEGTSLTYTFTMPAGGKIYTAKWMLSPVTLEKNIAEAGTVSGVEGATAVGGETTITATTNPGYTWLGWYDGYTKVSGGTTYTFTMTAENKTYTAKWTYYTISTETNLEGAGAYTVKTEDKVTVGETVELIATTNPGYTWLGWYDGDTKVSEGTSLTYTFTMSAENKTYTAKWAEYYVTVERNIEGAGDVYRDGGKIGDGSITFDLNGGSGTTPATQSSGTATYPTTIPTRSGYVFAGWYDNQACTGLPYDFTADVIKHITLYARWIGGRLHYNSSINVYANSNSSSDYYAFVPLASGQITITFHKDYDGYDIGAWLLDSNKSRLTETYHGSYLRITYDVTAGTLYYVALTGYDHGGRTTISLNGAMPEDGGVISRDATEMIVAEKLVTLTATTNYGYTWLGWYDGDTKVSEGTSLTYTFTMPTESKIYTAKWECYTISTETNLEGAGTYTVKTEEKVSVGNTIELTATTNPGYTWLGWYDGDTKVSEETTYTLIMSAESKTYTAKWTYYTISTETNLEGAGTYTVKTEERVTVGETVELTSTTNPGYTWLGWYDGDVKLCDDTTCTFTMPSESKTYTAKWACYTISTETNLDEAGTYTIKTDEKVVVGETVELTATTNAGYTWLGWYDGDTKVSEDLTYTFTMPAESKTYTAKWEISAEMQNFNFTGTSTTCTITGIKDKTVTSIVVPEYVTEISEGAFSGCSSLESLTIPFVGAKAGVTGSSTYQYPLGYLFGTSSYTGGVATEQYYYGSSTSSTTSTTYYIPSSLQSVTVTGGYIPSGAFEYCKNITNITLGDDATSIGAQAFYYCTSLTSVTIGNSVTTIGSSAFYNCDSLTSVTFGENSQLTTIGDYAFRGCTSLTSIVIPNSVTTIGNSAFRGCTSLTSVAFGENSQLTTIGYYAFWNCSSLTNVTFGENSRLTAIDDHAFLSCSSLTSITIPANVTTIEDNAFYECYALAEVYNYSSLALIKGSSNYGFVGYYATHVINVPLGAMLEQCEDGFVYGIKGNERIFLGYVGSETELTIASSVTNIGAGAFLYGCDSLTSVTFEENSQLTSIGNDAFYKCTSLTSITIPDSVTTIGSGAFYKCTSLTCITIPASVTSIGDSAFDSCGSITSISIPASVTSIGEKIFFNCWSLTNVVFEKDCQLTTISEYAFQYCSGLASIILPDGTTTISEYAFQYCSGLTSITLPDGITAISISAFDGCDSLAYNIYNHSKYLGNEANPYLVLIEATSTSITSVVINENCKIINDFAFWECTSLTSITIPASVTSIGVWAFSDCDNLTSVTFENTTNWYVTTNLTDWSNKTYGTRIAVTDAEQIAKCLTSTYRGYYWYKS